MSPARTAIPERGTSTGGGSSSTNRPRYCARVVTTRAAYLSVAISLDLRPIASQWTKPPATAMTSRQNQSDLKKESTYREKSGVADNSRRDCANRSVYRRESVSFSISDGLE